LKIVKTALDFEPRQNNMEQVLPLGFHLLLSMPELMMAEQV
jgi:hypothetical protein